MDDERIFGITKLKLQAFSLAALEMILGDIFVKVTSMMEHPDRYMINIRVCLKREIRSLRSDSHSIDYPQEVPPQKDLLGGPF